MTSELGCGTGLLGLTAATMGAEVVLTDLPVYLPSVLQNIEANKHLITGKISAVGLDWRERVSVSLEGSADLVLVCDCVYYEASLQPLIETILALVKPEALVILAYEKRPDKLELYQQFFSVIEKYFSTTEILNTKAGGTNDIFLLELRLLQK